MGVVRYALCFGVLLMHFAVLQNVDYGDFVGALGGIGVGCFFAFSGFLSFGSFFSRKASARHFFIDRMWRLLPAYFTVVLLAAFLLCACSTLPATRYFTDPAFWKYVSANLLFVNFLATDLPGVFDHNFIHAVNGALWTMKVEIMLELSIPLVWWIIKRFRCNPGGVFTVIYLLSALYSIALNEIYLATGNDIYNILGRQIFGQLTFFYTGVFLYFYYSRLMRHKMPVLVCCIALLAMSPLIPAFHLWGRPATMATLAILISMWGRWGTWEGSRDNISYNIYLVHFPVIQVAIATGLTQRLHPAWSLTAVVVVSVIISILINCCIERPVMRIHKKKKIIRFAS